MSEQVGYERLHLRLNTEKEADIIERLEQEKNKSRYIKELIKRDITMKQNRANKKIVAHEEWRKVDMVVLTYSDGSKQEMSRKVYDQMIEVKRNG